MNWQWVPRLPNKAFHYVVCKKSDRIEKSELRELSAQQRCGRGQGRLRKLTIPKKREGEEYADL